MPEEWKEIVLGISEHRTRDIRSSNRPDQTLKGTENKETVLKDMACPNEANKEEKTQRKNTNNYVSKYKKDV